MSNPAYAQLDQLVRLQFEAHGFSWLPRQPVTSLLSGRHASRLRGRGLTFEELRDYRPGDDIRTMDWRATARLRKPHVRVYTEERERPVLLVVDQRQSMFFGSQRTTKATLAVEAAALGAWRAVSLGDRVGAVVFGDKEQVLIRPQRSRKNVLRICQEMIRLNHALSADGPPAQATQLNAALRQAVQLANHDYLVVLVTDYFGDDASTQKLITKLAGHNDVLAALTYDPLGIRIPGGQSVEATDGQRRTQFHANASFNQRLQAEFQQRADRIRLRLRGIRVPALPLCTHEPVVDQLRAALGAR